MVCRCLCNPEFTARAERGCTHRSVRDPAPHRPTWEVPKKVCDPARSGRMLRVRRERIESELTGDGRKRRAVKACGFKIAMPSSLVVATPAATTAIGTVPVPSTSGSAEPAALPAPLSAISTNPDPQVRPASRPMISEALLAWPCLEKSASAPHRWWSTAGCQQRYLSSSCSILARDLPSIVHPHTSLETSPKVEAYAL